MKRFFITIVLIVLAFSAFAQKTTDNTLKFLGIPVDGTEQQMIAKLKEKGFRYDTVKGNLTGQFNGESVTVYIHTNHDLVDRIYVAFPQTSSVSDIRNKYNRLINQFQENNKYFSLLGNDHIPDEEDISYEMTVHDKQYQASFRYMNPDMDPDYFKAQLVDAVCSLYPEEEAAHMRTTMESLFNSSDEEQKEFLAQTTEALGKQGDVEWTPESIQQFFAIIEKFESLMTGQVWFTIHRNYGRYNIGLYYDNLANRANGEDL